LLSYEFDLQKSIRKPLNLFNEFEFERTSNHFEEEILFYNEVLDTEADIYRLDEKYSTYRIGTYVESERQLSRRWFNSLGIRLDYYKLAKQVTIYPRLSIRFNIILI